MADGRALVLCTTHKDDPDAPSLDKNIFQFSQFIPVFLLMAPSPFSHLPSTCPVLLAGSVSFSLPAQWMLIILFQPKQVPP